MEIYRRILAFCCLLGYSTSMETGLFIVSKIVAIVADPLFLLLFMSLLLLILVRKTDYRFLLYFSSSITIIVFALATPYVSQKLLFWETPLFDASSLYSYKPFDAIVVLGGAIDPSLSSVQINLRESAERMTEAFRLYKMGVAPLIIVSGGSGDVFKPDLREAPAMARFLRELGVEDSCIICEDASRNTFENAKDTAIILEKHNLRQIVLITSAFHMRRSAAIFTKEGIDFVPYTVDSRKQTVVFLEQCIPNYRSLGTSILILKEIAGFISYRLLGRL